MAGSVVFSTTVVDSEVVVLGVDDVKISSSCSKDSVVDVVGASVVVVVVVLAVVVVVGTVENSFGADGASSVVLASSTSPASKRIVVEIASKHLSYQVL